jgi:hypothetical protein
MGRDAEPACGYRQNIHMKRPILPERYLHSLRSFLDGIKPRKHLIAFFLEYVAVGDIYGGAHLVQ